MFIKHYGSTYIPHDFSGDLPIHAWHNYGPQYKPERKAMRVSIQILTSFPVKKPLLNLLLEDNTFTHIYMIRSEMLSSMILASWKSNCFPHTFHWAHLCLLTSSNWFTTLTHKLPCTQRLNKTQSQYPSSTEHLHINVPRGLKLWLQFSITVSFHASPNQGAI